MTRAVLDKLYNTSVCSHSASLGNEDAESLLAEVGPSISLVAIICTKRSFICCSVLKRIQLFCKFP